MRHFPTTYIALSTLPLILICTGNDAQASVKVKVQSAITSTTKIYNQNEDREGFPDDLIGGGTRYNPCRSSLSF